jgi:nitrogen regulatory protein P-II
MQMIVIVFRSSLEHDVRRVLADAGVTRHTDAQDVLGTGDAGPALGSFEWPGTNGLVLSALDDGDAARTVQALRRFHEATAIRQRGAPIPLRVFALPCTQVI